MTLRSDWRGVRLKQLIEQIDSGVSVNAVDVPHAVGEIGVLKTSCVSTGAFNAEQNKTVHEDERDRVACPVVTGRIIVSRMNTPQLVGAAGLVREPVDSLYLPDRLWQVTVRPDVSAGFLSHWMQTRVYRDQVASAGVGTSASMQNISQGDLRNVTLTIPHVVEQRAIADYLDRETARIDTLIQEQQRLVELLRERKQSLFAHVLLSGLIAGVDLRASGDPRIGEVPAHWRYVPTRYLCSITTGSEDSGNATEHGEFPFYIRGRQILRIGHYSFDCEAVMTPGDGQGGTGKVFHYFNGKFEAHQRVYVFKDFNRILGRYFYFYLSSFLRPVALAGSNTVTMESLRRPVLADFAVALPPIDEQRQIVAYLDEQTVKTDALVAEAERFIELSRERRSALITAAVTGQIDVRDEVA